MRLPIDTTAMGFIAAGAPAPVLEFDTGRPKVDPNGLPLFAVGLMAMADGAAEVITVKCAGEPQGMTAGVALRVVGLYREYYEVGERSGIPFRAATIEPASTTTATAAAPVVVGAGRGVEARDRP
ncbi:MAG: hypothetical protein ACYDEN_12365 [Acidimicrobiales bacterium]